MTDLLHSLQEGEVLIKVAYAGVNGGCETFRCRGEHAFKGNLTATAAGFNLGAEGAGTIVRMGSAGITNLSVGDHVTFIGGAFSEYVVAKAVLCWPVAEPSPAAVALTISATVANAALTYVGKMQRGETVLVTAAGGATGSFAVQLAKLCGCRVVATCGSEKKASRLEALGLERVINHSKEDVAHVLKSEYSGKIDIAYEGVGGSLQAAAWSALRRPGGRLLAVGYISEYPHVSDEVRAQQEVEQQKIVGLPPSANLFWGGQVVEASDGRVAHGKVWPDQRSDTVVAKRAVFDLYATGKLQAWVDGSDGDSFVGVEAVADAVDYMLTGQAVGKVVVKM